MGLIIIVITIRIICLVLLVRIEAKVIAISCLATTTTTRTESNDQATTLSFFRSFQWEIFGTFPTAFQRNVVDVDMVVVVQAQRDKQWLLNSCAVA